MIILQKNQIEKIEQRVKDYSGIILKRVTSRDISSKIVEHMEKIGILRFDDYLTVLDSGQDDRPVLAELISELTISESFFFRNPGQFEYLYEEYLPKLYAQKGKNHPIRIWSAGCAKGEESFSIALLAKRFHLDHPGSRFYINAGDINQKNLSQAKEGIYSSRALRNGVEKFESLLKLSLGSLTDDNGVVLTEDLKNMVQFRKLNLKQISSLKCMSGSDIIFCRNVLIYFEEKFRIELIKEFCKYLLPGGLLCLGESECLPKDITDFETVSHKGSYCYRRPSGNIKI